MCFCSFFSNWSVASRIKPHVIQRNVTESMTSNCFRQYICRYTVAKFWRYPIRRRVTKACALEFPFLFQEPDLTPRSASSDLGACAVQNRTPGDYVYAPVICNHAPSLGAWIYGHIVSGIYINDHLFSRFARESCHTPDVNDGYCLFL